MHDTCSMLLQVVWRNITGATYVIQSAATAAFSAAVNTTVPSLTPLCAGCPDLTYNPPFVRCALPISPAQC